MISFFRAHKRTITILLVVLCAFWLSPRFDIEFLLFVVLIVSQLFWIRRALDLGERFIPGKPRRIWLAVVATVVYAFFCVYSFTHFGILQQWHLLTTGRLPVHADPRLRGVLIDGVFVGVAARVMVGLCPCDGFLDGKGRVYYSCLGHAKENWDNPQLQKMYAEAIKWALGMVDSDITPRPLPSR